MPVILDTADGAVLTDNAVFHVIHIVGAELDLFGNAVFHLVQVFGVNDAAEGTARMRHKFFEACALENSQKLLVGIENFFPAVGVVYQKSAGDFVEEVLYLFCVRVFRAVLFADAYEL